MKHILVALRIVTFFAGLFFIYLSLGTLDVLPAALNPHDWFEGKEAHWSGGFIGLGGLICIMTAIVVK